MEQDPYEAPLLPTLTHHIHNDTLSDEVKAITKSCHIEIFNNILPKLIRKGNVNSHSHALEKVLEVQK